MSAHFEDQETDFISRSFVVASFVSSPVSEKEIIKAMNKAIKLLLEDFEEIYLKENPNRSILSIAVNKFHGSEFDSSFIGGKAVLTFIEPSFSGSENTVGDPQKSHRDTGDPQGESPELEDELNEDLGTCDWDGPEECESCQ